MGYYTKIDQQTVAVGVVEQVVVASLSGRGETPYEFVVENRSATETFDGSVWSSPNGSTQWTEESDDVFVGIAPGETRRLVLPADRIYVRVLGNFVGGPDTVRVSVLFLDVP